MITFSTSAIRKRLQAILFCGFLLPLSLPAQNPALYDLNHITTIEVSFPFSDWDYRLDTAKYGADSYTLAQEVKINGLSYWGAGVKYKGNSSYDSTQSKNPLHIELDFADPDGNYEGYTDLKLSNCWSDPSSVREVLAYSILRNYMKAPLSNFAKVYINGQYYGVYSSSENIDKAYLLRNFYTSNRAFFKCNPENVVNGQLPNLVYLGQDTTLYYTRYELKSDYGWEDMVDFCDTLANAFGEVEKVLDVDKALWMLAFNNLTVNLDSYTGQFSQNYYLYRDHNRRFIPIVWDLNMCFGSFNKSGTGNLSVAQMQQLSPLLHATNNAKPLIRKLLSDSTYLRMYIAHLRTMNNEFFANGAFEPLAAQYQASIDTSVQNEPYAFYSYAQFQNGLTQDVGTIPGIKNLMDTRAAYLASTPQFQAAQPSILAVNHFPAIPTYGQNLTFTASVSNGYAVLLGYRYKNSDVFTKVQMYDDGLHNDGSANDLVFGAEVPAMGAYLEYYVYAQNAQAGVFAPERAEHEFYKLDVSLQAAQEEDIVINEYLTDNLGGLVNEEGKSKDWIELYNTTAQALSLGQLYLSDDISKLNKWKFPDYTYIKPNDYLLVWADDKNMDLLFPHTSYNLNALGDSIFLSDAAGIIWDSTLYNNMSVNESRSRCANGQGPFVPTPPSPLLSNACTVAIDPSETASTFTVYPNPASTHIYMDVHTFEQLKTLTIRDMNGRSISVKARLAQNQLYVGDLSTGIYALEIQLESGEVLRQLWSKVD